MTLLDILIPALKTTPIARYLIDLSIWQGYSQQTLHRLLSRIHDQETWHAAYGVTEFRAIHAENAALLSKLLASMEESKVAA